MSRRDQRVLCANSDTLEPCTVGNLIRVLGYPTSQRESGEEKEREEGVAGKMIEKKCHA